MAKFESTFREEVSRLARKEIRKAGGPLKKDVVRLKHVAIDLSRRVAAIEKSLAPLVKAHARRPVSVSVTEAQVESSRMSPVLIKKLRKRLGITQSDLALLAGVSTPAVTAWEQGRANPRGVNRAAIVALRAVGRREIRQLLEMKRGGTKGAAKKSRGRRKAAGKKKTVAKKGKTRGRKKTAKSRRKKK